MPAPLRHSSPGRAATLTMRPPLPRHRADRRTAAQEASDEVHVDLLAQRRDAASRNGPAAKPPARWIDAQSGATDLVEPPDRRLVGEVAGDGELHLLVVRAAQSAAPPLR